jgi:hypothetical protein
MILSSRRTGRLLPALMLLCLPVGVGLGQTPEVEPNDTCPTAQELGSPPLPLVVTGELPRDTSDIDFFRFIAPPRHACPDRPHGCVRRRRHSR